MKKLFLFPILVIFFLVSCDGGTMTLTAPNMGGPEDLPASSATSYPASSNEAWLLFSEATATLLDTMDAEGTYVPSSSVRATVSDSESFSWVGSYGGGNVNITGELMSDLTVNDNFDSAPNSTYRDAMTMEIQMDVSGSYSGIDITDSLSSSSYTISGKIVQKSLMKMVYDITTDSVGDASEIVMDISMTDQTGYAMSVKRDDGLGGKFITSYVFEGKVDNLNLTGLFDDPEGIEEYDTLLDSLEIKLSVYNDNNELLDEYTYSYADIASL